ncbi:hypothetical protein EXIGLDRAFT_834215 [Exidia glandulosa HHB12029]|uniref:Fibronectin type-III domain-containing protein n=1 Tax=Exidia glandulosa HHB12029 TaxID=1314781 RepID=A0A165K0J2_EXIGL|nr:hypothetical protein EXIGLDRAFT_834215 [Exidia glandulosa HHB12029]
MRGLDLTSALLLATAASASNDVPSRWLNQSFFFSWDPVGAALPTPITKQCDVLPLSWNRGAARGPDPQAPYTIKVFNSITPQPLEIQADGVVTQYNLTIPFATGTQYQVCMFDSLGATGGCQAMYTVIDGRTACTTAKAAPEPLQALTATANYSQGLLSTYGWPDQCSDITVTPMGGKPPFTFMVSPALHPPLVFTSNSSDPITWKVALSWASPFFLSLTDSSDPPMGWTHGPLHAGGNGGTACLDTDALFLSASPTPSSSKSGGVSIGVAIGTLIAGLVVGAALGFFIPFCVRRYKDRDTPHMISKRSTMPASDDSHLYMRSARSPSSHQTVTPFAMEPFSPPPTSPPPMRHAPSTRSTSADNHHMQSHSASMSMGGQSQVYVIHQDSGRPPVSVVMAGGHGMDVTELPPGYAAAGNDGAPRPPPREKGRPARW